MDMVAASSSSTAEPPLPSWLRQAAFSPELALAEDIPLVLRAICEEGFADLELKGEDWERPVVRRWVAAVALRVGHVEDLFSATVADGVLTQPARLRREFRDRLAEVMAALAAAGVPSFGLGFDWAAVFGDGERRAALVGLLRGLGVDLQRLDLHLLLTVRIPGPPLPLAGLLREVMSPRILLTAEIHPHECVRREESPTAWLRAYRFQLSRARIAYDAEAGNRLTEKLLTPWFRALADGGPLDLCFRPRTASLERVFAELAALRQLLPSG